MKFRFSKSRHDENFWWLKDNKGLTHRMFFSFFRCTQGGKPDVIYGLVIGPFLFWVYFANTNTMKMHTPRTPFQSLDLEKRLALGLLAQPQSRNRKRKRRGSTGMIAMAAFAAVAIVFVPLILFLIKR